MPLPKHTSTPVHWAIQKYAYLSLQACEIPRYSIVRRYIEAAAQEKTSPCSLSNRLRASPSSGPAAEASTQSVRKRPAMQHTEKPSCKKAKRPPYMRRKIVPAAQLLAHDLHSAIEE